VGVHDRRKKTTHHRMMVKQAQTGQLRCTF
jgi:hypothetical protein